jgi:hypothetical protein
LGPFHDEYRKKVFPEFFFFLMGFLNEKLTDNGTQFLDSWVDIEDKVLEDSL